MENEENKNSGKPDEIMGVPSHCRMYGVLAHFLHKAEEADRLKEEREKAARKARVIAGEKMKPKDDGRTL